MTPEMAERKDASARARICDKGLDKETAKERSTYGVVEGQEG